MKKIRMTVVLAATMFVALGATQVNAKSPVSNCNSVGPVVSVSESNSVIPKKAQKFIEKNYPSVAVLSTEVDFPSQNVDVKLANGVELEFSRKGKLVEIEAADGNVLSESVLKNVLHRNTFKDLKERGLASAVEGVKHDRYGYKIDVNDKVYDEARYAESGILVALYED